MTVAKVIEHLRTITNQCESVRRGHITAVLVKHTHRLVALSDCSVVDIPDPKQEKVYHTKLREIGHVPLYTTLPLYTQSVTVSCVTRQSTTTWQKNNLLSATTSSRIWDLGFVIRVSNSDQTASTKNGMSENTKSSSSSSAAGENKPVKGPKQWPDYLPGNPTKTSRIGEDPELEPPLPKVRDAYGRLVSTKKANQPFLA
jgi:hypothetical protein